MNETHISPANSSVQTDGPALSLYYMGTIIGHLRRYEDELRYEIDLPNYSEGAPPTAEFTITTSDGNMLRVTTEYIGNVHQEQPPTENEDLPSDDF